MSGAVSGATKAFPFAGVIVGAAAGASHPERTARIAAAESALREAGAEPVLVVAPREVSGRTGMPSRTAGELASTIRIGMARLSNTAVVGALLWPVGFDEGSTPAELDVTAVLAIVDAAQRSGAPVVVPMVGGRRTPPFWFARGGWLELMTAIEMGLTAALDRHAGRGVELALEPGGPEPD